MRSCTLSHTVRAVCICTLITIVVGCSAMPFGRPPGEVLGSCKGTMRLESGRRTSFRFDLIRRGNDTGLFLTMPGRYRYRPVEDLDIGNGIIAVDLSSPQRTIRGEISGDSLTFTGNFEGWSGSFTLDIDD